MKTLNELIQESESLTDQEKQEILQAWTIVQESTDKSYIERYCQSVIDNVLW